MSLKVFKRLKFFRLPSRARNSEQNSTPKALAITVWVNTKTFEVSVQFQFGKFVNWRQSDNAPNGRVPVFEWYSDTKETSYFFNRNGETLELLKFLMYPKPDISLEKHNPAVGKDLILKKLENNYVYIKFKKNHFGTFSITITEKELEELKLILQTILPEIQKLHLQSLFKTSSKEANNSSSSNRANNNSRTNNSRANSRANNNNSNNVRNTSNRRRTEPPVVEPEIENSDATNANVVDDDMDWEVLDEFFSNAYK